MYSKSIKERTAGSDRYIIKMFFGSDCVRFVLSANIRERQVYATISDLKVLQSIVLILLEEVLLIIVDEPQKTTPKA